MHMYQICIRIITQNTERKTPPGWWRDTEKISSRETTVMEKFTDYGSVAPHYSR
jgi:hypothetical protein